MIAQKSSCEHYSIEQLTGFSLLGSLKARSGPGSAPARVQFTFDRMKGRHALALADAAADAVDDASTAGRASSSTGLGLSVETVEEHHVCARAVATLALVNGAHFYTICSLFPYAGFLAVDNGWAESVDAAGYVAGYLATATLLARIPTSVAWGYVADRWGWYPAVQVSLASLAVGSVAFGVAQPLWAALLSRCVFFGALNGWPALTGLVCGEVGGEAAQARVLSRVIGAGPIFALIGPAVGGWTYKLVPWLPPALPPNLVGAVLSLFAMVAAHINLRNVRRPPAAAAVAPAKAGGELAPREDPGEDPGQDPGQDSREDPRGTSHTRSPSPELLLVIFFRAVTGMVMFLIWDVFPLFCIASRGAGGLALSSSELGTLLAAAALLQTAYMLGVSGRVISRLGVARIVLLVGGVQGASLALLSLSQQAPLGVLALLYALNACCNATSLVVAIAATNVVGARHPRRKGTIQVGSPRALAPRVPARLQAGAPQTAQPRTPSHGRASRLHLSRWPRQRVQCWVLRSLRWPSTWAARASSSTRSPSASHSPTRSSAGPFASAHSRKTTASPTPPPPAARGRRSAARSPRRRRAGGAARARRIDRAEAPRRAAVGSRQRAMEEGAARARCVAGGGEVTMASRAWAWIRRPFQAAAESGGAGVEL